MKIKITSPCMAMLVYEAAKSGGQTEGCLCGEVAQESTKNITDSDVTTTVEDVLSVHSIGPLQLPENGFQGPGNHVDSNVFGWFHFCRRPLLRLTVREKSIHRKLAQSLISRNGLPGHIVTILMQERWSENHSTYLWKFAAFLQKDRWFVPCRIEIVNLKASVCGSYKPYPSIHQQQLLPQVTSTLSDLNSSFSSNSANASFDMVQTVRNTGQEIVKSLNETIVKLRETESKIEVAYGEQTSLKHILAELKGMVNKRDSQVLEADVNNRDHVSDTDQSRSSDSSDSGEYYGDERPVGLGHFLPQAGPSLSGPSSSRTPVEGADEPPPDYDPFDNLVHIVKADLQKGEALKGEEGKREHSSHPSDTQTQPIWGRRAKENSESN